MYLQKISMQTIQDGYCHYDKTKQRVMIDSYVNVTSGDEEALKLALWNKGATAVNIDASHKSLSFYQSGVYYEPDCSKFFRLFTITLVTAWVTMVTARVTMVMLRFYSGSFIFTDW